jgi:hypothetical protein
MKMRCMHVGNERGLQNVLLDDMAARFSGRSFTLQDIEDFTGISKSELHRIENRALEKLGKKGLLNDMMRETWLTIR